MNLYPNRCLAAWPFTLTANGHACGGSKIKLSGTDAAGALELRSGIVGFVDRVPGRTILRTQDPETLQIVIPRRICQPYSMGSKRNFAVQRNMNRKSVNGAVHIKPAAGICVECAVYMGGCWIIGS